MIQNTPTVKIGIVAVSRDCFPESLSVNRRKALVEAYAAKYEAADIYECPVCIVESEIHMMQALEDVKKAGCNAPIKQLYNLGVEIEENSELDLFEAFKKHEGDARIPDIVKDMEQELGAGNKKPEHAGRRYCTRTDYLLPSTEYGRQHPACLYCTGRGASGRDAFLWFHRYFCHPGDESLLPPCSDREKLPASRSSGIWRFWKSAV